MDLAAVERPAVVEPEAYSAHPHRRQKQTVIAGNFRHHQNRRYRNADGRGHEARHSDERERRRMDPERRGQKFSEYKPDSRAERAAADERRGEDSAGTAGAYGKRRCNRLEKEKADETEDGGRSAASGEMDSRIETCLNGRIARAENVREEKADSTRQQTAQRHLERPRKTHRGELHFALAEKMDVEPRAESDDERQHEIRQQPQSEIVDAVLRHRKERCPAEETRENRVGDGRGDETRQKRLVFDIARRIQDLETENRARERSLEKRGDAGGKPRGHQNAPRAHRKIETAGNDTAHRRTEKRYRPFVARRTAGADGQHGSDRFHRYDRPGDVAVAVVIGADCAVGAAGVLNRRKALDKQITGDRTERRQHHEQPPVGIGYGFKRDTGEKRRLVRQRGDETVTPHPLHDPFLAEIDHVPEGDNHQTGQRPDEHRFAEILAGTERKPLPREEKPKPRYVETSAHLCPRLAKGPALQTGPYCLFVFVALRLHTLVVFVLRHFFAPFFLDGTHFFSPWLLRFASENYLVERKLDDAGGTALGERRDKVAHQTLLDHGLDGEPLLVIELVHRRRVQSGQNLDDLVEILRRGVALEEHAALGLERSGQEHLKLLELLALGGVFPALLVGDEAGRRREDRIDDAKVVRPERTASLGKIDDRVDEFRSLDLGRAPAELDIGLDAVLLQITLDKADRLGRNALAVQILDGLDLGIVRNGEHPADGI